MSQFLVRENLRGLRENLKQKNPIPSRQLAESSPYFEALREKEVEILFCYEPYDELVLMQLQQFDNKKMTSVEKEMQQTPEEVIFKKYLKIF